MTSSRKNILRLLLKESRGGHIPCTACRRTGSTSRTSTRAKLGLAVGAPGPNRKARTSRSRAAALEAPGAGVDEDVRGHGEADVEAEQQKGLPRARRPGTRGGRREGDTPRTRMCAPVAETPSGPNANGRPGTGGSRGRG